MNDGIGSTVDILFLGIIVSLSLLIVIASVQTDDGSEYSFAEERARNTLLIFQKVPVEELESVSYKPDLSIRKPSAKKLEGKTLTKVIREEVLLNSTWIYENRIIEPKLNRELTSSLENSIRSSLNVLVGKRFDYRFKIRMGPESISENVSFFYRSDISDVSSGSRKICSETVKLFFYPPIDELDMIPITLTLELWSK